MTFREFAHTRLEPISIWVMVAGIIFLCQPWIEFLHYWSVAVMLAGFIGFNVAIHTPAPAAPTSGSDAVREGHSNG